jgi:hypothetical protein
MPNFWVVSSLHFDLCLWVGSPEQALKKIPPPHNLLGNTPKNFAIRKFFLSKIGHDWYKKTQKFLLVSKIQTYMSDKTHLKKVITKKHAKFGLAPKMMGIFGITFLRCIFSQR